MEYNWDEEIFKKFLIESDEKFLKINLDMYRLIALKKVIKLFANSNESWEYFKYNYKNKNHYLRIIVKDIKNMKWMNFENNLSENLKKFNVHICFEVEKFNYLSIQTYLIDSINGMEEYKVQIEINKINDLIYNEIIDIYNNIEKSELIENFFIEELQLSKGEIIGYYNFNRIKIDGGGKRSDYFYPRIIKCKIKYFKVICNDFKYSLPCIDTLEIDRKIILSLIQLLCRFSIDEYISDGKYYCFNDSLVKNRYQLDERYIGKKVKLDRNDIAIRYYEELPDDTEKLIEKFYNLSYDKQSIFLSSCDLCVKAKNSPYGEAITYYVIALENIANYHYKKNKISKKEKIYNLIKEVFFREVVSQDFVNYFYEIRCLFSHEGISNNRIKQVIFGVEDSDNKLAQYLEKITYSLLVKWLINQI